MGNIVFKEQQTILFLYDFYGNGEELYDGVITLVKEDAVHVSFLLKFRPVHVDIPKSKIVAVFDKNAPKQKIGDYCGNFLKVS